MWDVGAPRAGPHRWRVEGAAHKGGYQRIIKHKPECSRGLPSRGCLLKPLSYGKLLPFKNTLDTGPKPASTAQKASTLHTFGAQCHCQGSGLKVCQTRAFPRSRPP